MDNEHVAVQHYENFPVASLLCPAALRPAIVAVYHFARTADDLADEGDATAGATHRSSSRSTATTWTRRSPAVTAAAAGRRSSRPLAEAVHAHRHCRPALLHALLDAFVQDVRNPRYADRAALLDYCARSANPVGRLLLHLYRVGDALSLRQSDAICSALQLINFWQDLSVDLPRGRVYVPPDDAAAPSAWNCLELLRGEDSPAHARAGARPGRLGRRADDRRRTTGAAPAGTRRLGASTGGARGPADS